VVVGVVDVAVLIVVVPSVTKVHLQLRLQMQGVWNQSRLMSQGPNYAESQLGGMDKLDRFIG